MIATYDGGAASANSARSASSSASSTSGSLPSLAYCSRTLFVLSFASCTLGWSNGLLPRTQPPTAVANSAKNMIRPRSSGPSKSTVSVGCPAFASSISGVTKPGSGASLRWRWMKTRSAP